APFPLHRHQRPAQPPDDDGRHRQQHRQRQHHRLQDRQHDLRRHPQPDPGRRRRPAGPAGRHQPRPGRPGRAGRRHHHQLRAGRHPGDRPQHRHARRRRRVLRRAPERREPVHPQRRVQRGRQGPAGQHVRRPGDGLAGAGRADRHRGHHHADHHPGRPARRRQGHREPRHERQPRQPLHDGEHAAGAGVADLRPPGRQPERAGPADPAGPGRSVGDHHRVGRRGHLRQQVGHQPDLPGDPDPHPGLQRPAPRGRRLDGDPRHGHRRADRRRRGPRAADRPGGRGRRRVRRRPRHGQDDLQRQLADRQGREPGRRHRGHAAVVAAGPGRHDHRHVQQRAHHQHREDRDRELRQPGGPGEAGRLALRRHGQLRRARDRLPGRRRARHAGLRRAGDVERRPGAGVHQPHRQPARLPGQQPRHHLLRRDAPGAGQPQAL
ncbi:MAG: Flagellar hook protein FlgE, partial [uncultured Quadrisphaera sp.]